MEDVVLTITRYRNALAKSVSLLEQAEYSGGCNSEGDCHG
jgi:hypothetical protein